MPEPRTRIRAVSQPRTPGRRLGDDPVGQFATHQAWCKDMHGDKARARWAARAARDAAARAARTKATGNNAR